MQTRPEDWGVAYARFDKSAAKTVLLVFFVEGDVDSRWPAVSDLDKIKKKKQQIGDRKGESGGQT